MPVVTLKNEASPFSVPQELLEGKRRLTEKEIQILKAQDNSNSDETWQNIFVPLMS